MGQTFALKDQNDKQFLCNIATLTGKAKDDAE
jgi:hypothetical protein